MNSRYRNKLKRIILVTILILLIACKNNFFPVLIDSKLSCYYDVLFELTSSINSYLIQNTEIRHALLCFASLCLDSLVLLSYVVWIVDWEDWILFLSVLMFYTIRAITFSLFQIRFPNNYAFDHPGFPSITVSYLVSNDFFFSGHVGLPTILSFYYYLKLNYLMVFFALLVGVIQATMMLLLRGHYSIDLLFGILMSYYSVRIAEIINPYFKKFIRLNDQRFNLNDEQTKAKKYIYLNNDVDELQN